MTEQEKLEEAKRLYTTANADQKYVLESLFPELKESEDERIRKAIIESLPKYGYLPQTSIKVEDAIAWLEKQGDKDKLIQELGEYKVKYTQEVLSQYLEKLSEQKPAERDLKNVVPTQRLLCFEGGACTNPFHDCINCPRQTSDGSWISTRITSITDIKENRE